MASRNRKTTMAKLNREQKVLEKRLDKQARKEDRKARAAQGDTEQNEAPLEPAPSEA